MDVNKYILSLIVDRLRQLPKVEMKDKLGGNRKHLYFMSETFFHSFPTTMDN